MNPASECLSQGLMRIIWREKRRRGEDMCYIVIDRKGTARQKRNKDTHTHRSLSVGCCDCLFMCCHDEDVLYKGSCSQQVLICLLDNLKYTGRFFQVSQFPVVISDTQQAHFTCFWNLLFESWSQSEEICLNGWFWLHHFHMLPNISLQLKWPCVIWSHSPALFAYKHHFSLQRLFALFLSAN